MLIFFTVTGILALTAIISRYAYPRFYYFTKPLPMTVIIAFAGWEMGYVKTWPYWLVFFALVAGFLGDLLLLFKRFFLAGLGSFLLGHILYSLAFYHSATSLPLWFVALWAAVAFSFAIFMIYNLKKEGRHKYVLPVAAYIVILTIMAISAFSLQGVKLTFVSGGALLFVLSDSALAIEKFVKPLKYAQIFILITYYSSQALLAWGVYREYLLES